MMQARLFFNNTGSLLSSFIDFGGYQKTLFQFMRSIFNIIPTLFKYNYTWDVGIPFIHISKINHGNLIFLSTTNIKQITI